MSLAFVFPGQGSQSVGMLAALAADEPAVEQTFSTASRALGYDLWALVQNGPEAALNATDKTQPAMLAAGVAVWRAWLANGGARPSYLAGHSLGEYTALVCAGALELEAAVRLVEFRGQVMQKAVPEGHGAMAAIIGLADAAVREGCAEAAQGEVVEAVNYNAPGQVVIAGHASAVARAADILLARGARRVLPLPVSVPSHCSLMAAAAGRLAERLDAVAIEKPRIPIIHNVDAREHADPGAIREALVAQLHSPVLWVDTIRALAERGVVRVIECGPGKVLQGLVKRTERALESATIHDAQSLHAQLGEGENDDA
jgi:[acyl-carrier-protein] S-malonyltransferase